MFDFFIALFGGLFWGSKYSNDKSKLKQAQITSETNRINDQTRKSLWLSKVVDEKLENELEAFIFDIANYDKVWEEISEAYKEMPWEKEDFICTWEEAVTIAYGKGTYTKKQRENIAANNRLKALRIMLAKRGKLRRLDADWGIPTSMWEGVPVLTMRQWAEEETKLMLWITQQLANHGVNEKLYINHGTGDAVLAATNPCHNGRYMWEPMIPHYTTKHN